MDTKKGHQTQVKHSTLIKRHTDIMYNLNDLGGCLNVRLRWYDTIERECHVFPRDVRVMTYAYYSYVKNMKKQKG